MTWDEPDLLQGVSRVSPWQVELVATLPMQLPPFSLPKKKLRAVQPPELQLQAPGLLGLPLGTGSSTLMGQLPAPWGGPALLDDASAGMQGARHDRIYGLPTLDFRTSNYKHPREFHNESYYNPELVPPARNILNDASNQFSTLPERPHLPSNHSVGYMPSGSPRGENSVIKGTSTSFFLFGQSIDPTHTSKSQQHYPPGNSSSDGPLLLDGQRASTTSNSSSDNTQENKDRVRRFMPTILNGEQGGRGLGADGAISRFQQNDSSLHQDPSSGSVIGSLKWFKDQGFDKEKASSDSLSHCKVFREGEEVGRTLDLTIFTTYEELYERLAVMFIVPQSEFQDRVVYKDVDGVTKRIGEEPYRLVLVSPVFQVQ